MTKESITKLSPVHHIPPGNHRRCDIPELAGEASPEVEDGVVSDAGQWIETIWCDAAKWMANQYFPTIPSNCIFIASR
ncbi:hypothetical protein CGMCC3_g15545 [Colletotrichum fructicola]|nr:uncharacterized protein CGMCC3_g15545 [Colletotrichum fructicola]KAE9568327.1 hypothetical protein CGMCC3_g15545 [Colletotrichum fructicola]